MKYRDLFRYFPVISAFAQRKLPLKVALGMGVRVKKLRELYQAIDAERIDLLKEHAELDENGRVLQETDENGVQQAVIRDRRAFDEAWAEMLDAELDGWPDDTMKPFSSEQFPDDMDFTSLEVEALMTLGILRE